MISQIIGTHQHGTGPIIIQIRAQNWEKYLMIILQLATNIFKKLEHLVAKHHTTFFNNEQTFSNNTDITINHYYRLIINNYSPQCW